MKRNKVAALLLAATVMAGGTVSAAVIYNDVSSDAPYAAVIEKVDGIVEGLTDNEFGVSETATRGAFIESLYNLAEKPAAGECTFEDAENITNKEAEPGRRKTVFLIL